MAKFFEIFTPAAFIALHWYVLPFLLFIESNARILVFDTTFPDVVVHIYCAAGFETTEQLT